MIAGKRAYYWDACVFIAWLQDEHRKVGEMDGVADVVRAVDNGEAILMSSVMILPEVLACRLSDAAIKMWEAVLRRRHIALINADQRVAQLAHEIRNFHQTEGVKVSTPDSMHLATAILYQADEFHTFDGSGATPRKSKLIPLSGHVAGVYPLKICVPSTQQPSLLTTIESELSTKPLRRATKK
jgi:hypothetical protein